MLNPWAPPRRAVVALYAAANLLVVRLVFTGPASASPRVFTRSSPLASAVPRAFACPAVTFTGERLPDYDEALPVPAHVNFASLFARDRARLAIACGAAPVMTVFVPVGNFRPDVDAAFASLLEQTYPRLHVLVVDDASSDGSAARIAAWRERFLAQGIPFDVLRSAERVGPGGSKWAAISAAAARGDANAYFLILDGDDRLLSPTALERVAVEYLAEGALFVYGSCAGTWCEQGRALPPPAPNVSEAAYDFRDASITGSRKFIYQHPRSCAAALLPAFTESDFQMDGEFLRKASDSPFIFKAAELSGPARVRYVPEAIYAYRVHANATTLSVDPAYRALAKAFVRTRLPRSKPFVPDIHIIMCMWRRRTLAEMLGTLANQTVAQRIVLHVVINRDEDAAAGSYRAYMLETLSHGVPPPLRVRLYDAGANIAGYARFVLAKKLLEAGVYLPHVAFVDDDQQFGPEFVERLWAARIPLGYTAWYGRLFGQSWPPEYWNNALPRQDLARGDLAFVPSFDYGGTCGAVVDTFIFRTPELFRCPRELRIGLEDLWLSFVIGTLYRSRIAHFAPSEAAAVKDLPSATGEHALYQKLSSEKQVALEMLATHGFVRGLAPPPGTEVPPLPWAPDDSAELVSQMTEIWASDAGSGRQAPGLRADLAAP